MSAADTTLPPRRARSGPFAKMAAFWRASGLECRLGLVVLAVFLFVVAFGPMIAPYGMGQLGTGVPLSGASWAHPFGVDQLGRDVFSRVLYGTRVVVLLSVIGTAFGLVLGALIGLVSGYVGGVIDNVIQRIIEGFVSIPFIVLALLTVYTAGPAWSGKGELMILVLAIVYAPRVARMARAAALDVITQDYVLAAQLRGEKVGPVVWYEIVPNVMSTLMVEFAVRTAYAPALIATLGFLGFGVKPPMPEWGSIIAENRSLLLISPSTVLAPGLCLAGLVVAINAVAEGAARYFGKSTEVASQ
jgi:peptide/nickel transport system permease protein